MCRVLWCQTLDAMYMYNKESFCGIVYNNTEYNYAYKNIIARPDQLCVWPKFSPGLTNDLLREEKNCMQA